MASRGLHPSWRKERVKAAEQHRKDAARIKRQAKARAKKK